MGKHDGGETIIGFRVCAVILVYEAERWSCCPCWIGILLRDCLEQWYRLMLQDIDTMQGRRLKRQVSRQGVKKKCLHLISGRRGAKATRPLDGGVGSKREAGESLAPFLKTSHRSYSVQVCLISTRSRGARQRRLSCPVE